MIIFLADGIQYHNFFVLKKSEKKIMMITIFLQMTMYRMNVQYEINRTAPYIYNNYNNVLNCHNDFRKLLNININKIIKHIKIGSIHKYYVIVSWHNIDTKI